MCGQTDDRSDLIGSTQGSDVPKKETLHVQKIKSNGDWTLVSIPPPPHCFQLEISIHAIEEINCMYLLQFSIILVVANT